MLGISLSAAIHQRTGAALPVPVPPPAGLSFTPDIAVFRDQFGAYTHDFDAQARKPAPTHTVYVGKGGDNTADGLSWSSRVRSIKQGLVRAAGLGSPGASTRVRLLVQAGEYRFSEQDVSGIPDSWAGQSCQRNLIIEPCDGFGSPSMMGRIRSVHDQVMPPFLPVAGSSTVYASVFTSERVTSCVWDRTYADEWGNPLCAHNAPPPSAAYANEAAVVAGLEAMHAAEGEGACWLDATGKKLYVRLRDGRAPDANMIVGRGTNDSVANPADWNIYYGGIHGTLATLWATRLDALGGGGFYLYPDWSGNRRASVVLDQCDALYSANMGFLAYDATNVILHRCRAAYCFNDGVAYDQPGFGTYNPDAAFTGAIIGASLTVSAMAGSAAGVLDIGMVIAGAGVAAGTRIIGKGSGTGGVGTYLLDQSQSVSSTAMTGTGGLGGARFHELDCRFRWCGNNSQFDTSRNASSAHVNCTGLRINSHALSTQNRAFHDIHNARSWNLGCVGESCRQTGVQSAAFTAGLEPNSNETAQMWLDGCQSLGNTADLQAHKGAGLRLRNMGAIAAFQTLVSGGGTIALY
ncbi:hypothetical protein [Devosia sp. 1566]|uniref:hypothetical protein n=1 Tax=Devosia sp. 1566 TaxID=2499144 RepID=UPI000FDBA14B|nr:hypothetical protein [Devosia sp. 1566]